MNVHCCTIDDLAGLDTTMPLGDGAHRQRLEHQWSGTSTYLVATLDGPVGVCIVRWEGPFDASVAARWPDCVEVNHLYVLSNARNRGVGGSLIGAAEARCRERKLEQVGTGVADDNSGAARLYERLGYRDSGDRYVTSYQHFDADGTPHHATERNRFLIKQLDSAGQ